MCLFLMSQGSFSPKIGFLGQKVCSVAREQIHMKVNTEDTLSEFQEFFLQPIIKDQNISDTVNFLTLLVSNK